MTKRTPFSDRDDIPDTEKPAEVAPFPAPEKASKGQIPKPVAPPVTTRKWGLDIQAINRDLPPPGRYIGVISDITFKDRGSDLLMMVSYELDGCNVTPRKDFGTVAAEENAEIDREQLVQGLQLLEKICHGIGITLDEIADDVRGLSKYIGTPVHITIAHKRSAGGVKELVARRLDPIVEG